MTLGVCWEMYTLSETKTFKEGKEDIGKNTGRMVTMKDDSQGHEHPERKTAEALGGLEMVTAMMGLGPVRFTTKHSTEE